jgi:hypothetical protein
MLRPHAALALAAAERQQVRAQLVSREARPRDEQAAHTRKVDVRGDGGGGALQEARLRVGEAFDGRSAALLRHRDLDLCGGMARCAQLSIVGAAGQRPLLPMRNLVRA